MLDVAFEPLHPIYQTVFHDDHLDPETLAAIHDEHRLGALHVTDFLTKEYRELLQDQASHASYHRIGSVLVGTPGVLALHSPFADSCFDYVGGLEHYMSLYLREVLPERYRDLTFDDAFFIRCDERTTGMPIHQNGYQLLRMLAVLDGEATVEAFYQHTNRHNTHVEPGDVIFLGEHPERYQGMPYYAVQNVVGNLDLLSLGQAKRSQPLVSE